MYDLSIIIPTTRASVLKTLSSIPDFPWIQTIVVIDGEPEIIPIIGNKKGLIVSSLEQKHNDFGAYARTEGMKISDGKWISFMDDDDIYLPETWNAYQEEMKNGEGLVLFRMERGRENIKYPSWPRDILWYGKYIEIGNVSSQMIFVYNDKEKLGTWGSRYVGDFDFIQSTAEKWGKENVRWNETIVCSIRDNSWSK